MAFDASYDMDKAARFAAECRQNSAASLAAADKIEADKRTRNALYIERRKAGDTPDEAFDAVAVASGIAPRNLRLDPWDDDRGDNIAELERLYLR